MKSVFAVLSAALVLSACGMEPSPLPAGAIPMVAHPEYATWWQSTEACSGLTGNFARVEWYQVPNVSTFQSRAGTVVGLWENSAGRNRITIAGDYLDNELVVRHEMLHALLDRAGHPQEYFVTRCSLTWASWSSQPGSAGAAGSPVASGTGLD